MKYSILGSTDEGPLGIVIASSLVFFEIRNIGGLRATSIPAPDVFGCSGPITPQQDP